MNEQSKTSRVLWLIGIMTFLFTAMWAAKEATHG